jgi:Ran GTPase-activating protein (RanGAP) involved in mRNA processing and transport
MISNLLRSILILLLVSLAFAASIGDQKTGVTGKSEETSQEESTLDTLFQKFLTFLGIARKSGSNANKDVERQTNLLDLPDDIWRNNILRSLSAKDAGNLRLANTKLNLVTNSSLKGFSPVVEACGKSIAKKFFKQQWSADYQDEAWFEINDQTLAKKVNECLQEAKKWVETLDEPRMIRVEVRGTGVHETIDFLLDKTLFEITSKVRFRIKLLVLNYRNLSRKVIRMIKENKCIQSLQFLGNSLGEDQAAKLASLLDTKSGLQELSLSNTYLGPDGEVALAEALKINTALLKLSLNSENIGDRGVKALADALKSNTALQYLSLENNRMPLLDAPYFSLSLNGSARRTFAIGGDKISGQGIKALISNTKLKELYVSDIEISDQDAEVIAEALRDNNDLRVLRLKECRIGDKGARAFADALKINTALLELDLRSNRIGDTGAESFASLLKKNTNLLELDLSRNWISGVGAKALAEGLKVNTALKKLTLIAKDFDDLSRVGKLLAMHVMQIPL